MAILISDREDFRAKKVVSDKKSYYKMKRGSILQEDITILNVMQLTTASKYESKTDKTARKNR